MKQKPSIRRRDFLKSASAAIAAGPLVVSASALGLGKAVAASERVNVGCIGVGGQGTSNMQAFMHDSRAQIVALCDVDAAHRARALEITELKADAASNDFRALLSRDDIDVVSIATPDHWHAIITIAAARAGKDIYCEKPLSLTIPEGRAMVDEVRAAKRILQTGTWRRSRETCRRACELVRNGFIGELKTIETAVPKGYAIRGTFAPGHPPSPIPEGFDYELWLGPAPSAEYTPGRCHFNFRWILDYSEGYISDWGAHFYDVAQWGANTDHTGPVAMDGTAVFPKEGLYDAATEHRIEFTYESGLKLISSTSDDSAKHGVKFTGTEGWIFVESAEVKASSDAILKAELPASAERLYASDNHHANFIDCVLNRTEPAAPVEVGHRSAAICHLGHIATLLKRPLQWDPQHERFYGDDEANALLSRPMRKPWSLSS